MDPLYLAVAVAIAIVGIIAVYALSRRPLVNTETSREDERSQQLEADILQLREEKSLLERRLATQEERASRLPELEELVASRSQTIEALTEAKSAAERQVAVSDEALRQGQIALRDIKERLTTTEATLEGLRSEKTPLEEALATRSEAVARLEISFGETRDRLAVSEQAHKEASAAHAVSEQRNVKLEGEVARLKAILTEKDSATEKLAAELESVKGQSSATQTHASELESDLARLQETLTQERKQSQEKLQLLAEAREQMTQEFRVLANDVMKSHGETFSKQNKEQVDAILNPLRDKLVDFQTGLQKSHEDSVKERATLAEQIRQLSGNSEKMSMQAASLANALRGEAQTQGAWGEMILESILERSGLREGEEYITQQTHSTEEGQRLRPDVVVNLPGEQKLVIDSKVSLVAFDEYVNSASEQERNSSLDRHIASIRSHIKTLSNKEYHAAVGSQLDYVVMFVPIEGALAAALQRDPDLTADAVKNNVAIATPTTLMIALRTVSNVWHVERRNQNAENIAVQAGRIYDKLVGFVEDMESLGKRLNQAHECHTDAMKKLSSGRGNLAQQVQRLKILGAKTTKSLPWQMVNLDETELADIEEEITLVAPQD